MLFWTVVIFSCLFAASPWCSSATALILGMILSLGFQFQLPKHIKSRSKVVMQAAIVLMGFSMSPEQVLASGREGLWVTLITLLIAIGAGALLASMVKIKPKLGFLISAGTGICGGSAIASMAPVIRAEDEDIAVAMACVFLLNAVALVVFPTIGQMLSLTPEQFGWFAAIAIHDTSSVVGAATEFSPDSVAIAVTAKLTRALWIIPMMIVGAFLMKWLDRKKETSDEQVKMTIPWFILVFVMAVAVHGFLPKDIPLFNTVYEWSNLAGKSLLKVAILLTGLQLSRAVVKKVGLPSMTHALILWVVMSSVTLSWILYAA